MAAIQQTTSKKQCQNRRRKPAKGSPWNSNGLADWWAGGMCIQWAATSAHTNSSCIERNDQVPMCTVRCVPVVWERLVTSETSGRRETPRHVSFQGRVRTKMNLGLVATFSRLDYMVVTVVTVIMVLMVVNVWEEICDVVRAALSDSLACGRLALSSPLRNSGWK